MKQLIALLTILLTTLTIDAQNVISVKSSATVQLEVETYTYTVPSSALENSMFGALSFLDELDEEEWDEGDWGEEDNSKEDLLAVIATTLVNNGYEFKVVEASAGRKYELIVKSEAELQKLQSLMDGINAEGAVTDQTFESQANHYDALFIEMSMDAKKQAESIARATNLKLGKLISVEEVAEQFDMGSYMDMFKDGGALTGMFGLSKTESTKDFTKEMLFTFSVVAE